MRISRSRSKNACSYYLIDNIRTENGKFKTHIIEKLGTEEYIKEKYHVDDAEKWCQEYLDKKRQEELITHRSTYREVKIELTENRLKNEKSAIYNVGYLLLEKVYHEFGLSNICDEIQRLHPHVKGFSLDNVLKAMLFGRIIDPASKLGLVNNVQSQFLECANLEVQHVYRAMDLLEEHADLIQDRLFYYSNKSQARTISRLYYDCTNFYSEVECEDCDIANKSDEWHQEHTLRKYGKSKENRPNPIVQLGMFMDGDGVPLGITVFPGNNSEKPSMKPLEEKLLQNFRTTDVVVCADCGLSTFENRVYNNCTSENDVLVQYGLKGQKHYVFVQSIKQLKTMLQDWALDADGWSYVAHINGKSVTVDSFSLNSINENNYDEFYNIVFFKERTIAEKGLDQRLIVTFSLKYQEYMRSLSGRKVKRAYKMMETGSFKTESEHSPRSLIKQSHTTDDGTEATQTNASLNQQKIEQDARFDGFYCTATNLFKNECTAGQIAAIGARRWEIEESFRIMKTELKARPFYHNKDSRIIAHLLTCFMSLVLIRGVERKIASHVGPHIKYPDGKYTVDEIIHAIKNIRVISHLAGTAYEPDYNNSEVISELLDIFDLNEFKNQVVLKDTMKNILKKIKKSPEMYNDDDLK